MPDRNAIPSRVARILHAYNEARRERVARAIFAALNEQIAAGASYDDLYANEQDELLVAADAAIKAALP